MGSSSSSSSGSTGSSGTQLPAAPQNLLALGGDGQVTLSWDPVPGATGYRLYWAVSPAVSKANGSVIDPATSPYVHLGPTNGATYFYVVTALNAAGESAESVSASATAAVVDTTPPAVAHVRPRAGEVAVDIARAVVVRFTEPLDGASATPSTVFLTGPGGAVPASVAAAGDAVTLTPDSPLAPETNYTLTASTGLRDLAGNALAADFTERFTTASPAPTNPQAVRGNTQITVLWDPVPGADRYTVLRAAASGGPYTPVLTSTGASATDRGLSNGTASSYVVVAHTPFGDSAPSAEVSATPSPALLAAPLNLGTVAAGTGAVVTWSPVSGATGYTVLRAGRALGPYTPVATGLTAPSFVDSGLSAGQTYHYAVQASNGQGPGAYSTDIAVRLPAQAPAAPTGLTGTAGNGWVRLDWQPVAGASHYLIYRQGGSNDPGYKPFGVQTRGTSFLRRGAPNGLTYAFLVVAVAGGVAGDPAGPVSLSPASGLAPLPATDLVATSWLNGVQLTWGGAEGSTRQQVYRATQPGGPYTLLATPVTGPYTDSTAATGTTYSYVVRAVNGSVPAADSNEVSAAPLTGTPGTPQNVVARPGNGATTLNWDPVPGATFYSVDRATAPGGPYTNGNRQLIGQNSAVYTDDSETNGTTYYFRVRAGFENATTSDSTSPPSVEVSSTPSAALPVQPSFNVRAGNDNLQVYWNPVGGTTSYTLFRREVGGVWGQLGTASAGLYTDATAAAGKRYQYAVEATGPGGTGARRISNSLDATDSTLPPTPQIVNVQPGNGKITLFWDRVPGATAYDAYFSLTPGGPYGSFSQECYSNWGDPLCTFSNLANGTSYFFVVRAVQNNPDGSNTISTFSAEMSAAPSSALPDQVAPSTSVGAGEAQVTWPGQAGATSYQVYRKVGDDLFAPLTTTTEPFFRETGLEDGLSYAYAVVASNASGPGPWYVPSLQVSDATRAPAPANVQVQPGKGAVTVSWDPVPGAQGYEVYGATSPGGPYGTFGGISCSTSTTEAHDTRCTVTGLANATTYSFVVRTSPYGIRSSYSAEASATPATSLLPPVSGASSDLRPGSEDLSVLWQATPGATSYRIYRRTHATDWSLLGSPTEPLWFDHDVDDGTDYTYAIEAVNAAGPSPWWSTSYRTPSSSLPRTPAGLRTQPGNGAVTVSWEPVNGATGYTVQGVTAPGGPYNGLGAQSCTTSGNYETHCTFTSAANGTTYYYLLRAENAAGSGAWTGEGSATPLASLPARGSIGLGAGASPGTIHTSWSAVAGASSYRLYRREPTSNPILAAETASTGFDDFDLASGTPYTYYLEPRSPTGPGAWSTPAQAAAP